MPVPARLRLAFAIFAGRLAAAASRLAGRGSGASIRGQVMTTIDPLAFAKLLAGRRIMAVTGTNGKTTTTHFLAAAVKAALGLHAHRLVTNADGANLHHGIASALSEKPHADIAVLETDERVVADLISHGKPEVLVMLNLSRDQLDRHHEISSLASRWRDALLAAGPDGPIVVACAEEPMLVWAAQGAHRSVWIRSGSSWSQDASLCPACGSLLRHNDGEWSCIGCELRQPKSDFTVADGTIIAATASSWTPQLQVPGRFNISNAACALAAASQWGIAAETALAGMATITSPAGRFGTCTIADVKVRLLLAKNPAGWAEALPLGTSDPLVLAIDSVLADGTDVSWLWDVNFEQLTGRKVIASGPRAADLAVRLQYAQVDCELSPDLASAIDRAGQLTTSRPVDVLSTYTPFQKLRKLGGLA